MTPHRTSTTKKIGVFSIASKNYLSYVRVLFNSLSEVHPEYRFFLCLADKIDGEFDPATEIFEVVEADALGITNFDDFAFRYDIMEFNTAVKPFMFQWLFAHSDLDSIIYLDPDIRCFSRLDHLEKILDGDVSVVLTPHITAPIADQLKPNDYHMLQSGTFNLGFIAARRCEETLNYMSWWGQKLQTQCINDLGANLFVDQKWCDLAPSLLEHLHVLRDTGYNVAYWNLPHRNIERTFPARFTVNGAPLVFFHFSGVDAANPRALSKHQNRYTLDELPFVAELVDSYISELHQQGWDTNKKWAYAYGRFNNGTPIHSLMRRVYRKKYLPGNFPFGSPFSAGPVVLCNPAAELDANCNSFRISILMQEVYTLRPDVQSILSLADKDGQQRFAHWFEISGPREYGFPDSITSQTQILDLQKKTAKPAYSTYRLLIRYEQLGLKMSNYLPQPIYNQVKRSWLALKKIALSRV